MNFDLKVPICASALALLGVLFANAQEAQETPANVNVDSSSNVTVKKFDAIDLSASANEPKKDAPQTQPEQTTEAPAVTITPTVTEPAQTYPEPQTKYLFEKEIHDFSQNTYWNAVESLISAYEEKTGRKLVPGEKKKVALKIYTESGRGLETPKNLTRAVRGALIKRGFSAKDIILVDLQERTLRQTGYLPPLRKENDFFWEGSPVIALDTGNFYNEKWFYENNLPSKEPVAALATTVEDIVNERKSYLPIPLIFDVDFWINLPVAFDLPALGVSGAIGNETIWNISNQRRFLDNPANAVQMALTVATIPEFRKKFELTILSLEKFQFIGGPIFNENYVASEKRIWLSANPVIIDFLMWQRMNTLRNAHRFDLILPEPPLFSAAGKGSQSLGSCVFSELELVVPGAN